MSTPPDQVFQYVANPENGSVWIPHLVELHQSSLSQGEGLELSLVAFIAGRELVGQGRCVMWDPPTYFALEIIFENGVRSRLDVELEAGESETTVYTTIEYIAPSSGFGKFAANLVGESLLKRELEKAMRVLKTQLERAPSAHQ